MCNKTLDCFYNSRAPYMNMITHNISRKCAIATLGCQKFKFTIQQYFSSESQLQNAFIELNVLINPYVLYQISELQMRFSWVIIIRFISIIYGALQFLFGCFYLWQILTICSFCRNLSYYQRKSYIRMSTSNIQFP